MTDTVDATATMTSTAPEALDREAAAPRGLRVHDLVVRYPAAGGGETVAVDGVSLDVAPGQVVALLGASGCGKSSLLRAVAGLEPAAAGSVAWDGDDLAGLAVHRRGFGLMFQDGQLFPHRDVAGNVEFGLRMARVDRVARTRRVSELLDLVGLSGYQSRQVATLSGGEQQRVALARALAPAPRLLLLDEPLSALDRALRERLADDLRTALTSTGTTALLVTHDHDEAFAIADRVAVMSAGLLLQVDEPGQLWQRPVSREVAAFLGYEAFVDLDGPSGRGIRAVLSDGRARSDGHARSGAVAALASGAFVVADQVAAPVVGAGATVGSASAGYRAVVRSLAFRRGRTELSVELPGIGQVTALAPAGVALRPGAEVVLHLDPSRIAVIPDA